MVSSRKSSISFVSQGRRHWPAYKRNTVCIECSHLEPPIIVSPHAFTPQTSILYVPTPCANVVLQKVGDRGTVPPRLTSPCLIDPCIQPQNEQELRCSFSVHGGEKFGDLFLVRLVRRVDGHEFLLFEACLPILRNAAREQTNVVSSTNK